MALFHQAGCTCPDCQRQRQEQIERIAADPELAEFYKRLRERRDRARWRLKLGAKLEDDETRDANNNPIR